jgi:hypothetical protein
MAMQSNSRNADYERLYPLSELAKLLPAVRGHKPPNRSTLYRWATNGLKSRSGQCIRMEAKFVGGTIVASLDDVNHFCDALDDRQWQPTPYKNRREEERMKRDGRAAIERALAPNPKKPPLSRQAGQ